MILAITIIGQEGHVAYPALARNPLGYAGFLMDYICEYFPEIEPIAFITGNPALNVIPRSCVLRFIVPEHLESTARYILQEFFNDPQFTINWVD